MTELLTPRLHLRQFQLPDFEAYSRICADPEVMEHLGGVLSRHDAWRHMAMLLGHWQLLGFGHWAVVERDTSRLVGRIGFLYPEGWPGFELGWTLARDSWGKGYATEGASAALHWAFTVLKRDHIISLIRPENHRSARVAQRIGESPEDTTQLLGRTVTIFGIHRHTHGAT